MWRNVQGAIVLPLLLPSQRTHRTAMQCAPMGVSYPHQYATSRALRLAIPAPRPACGHLTQRRPRATANEASIGQPQPDPYPYPVTGQTPATQGPCTLPAKQDPASISQAPAWTRRLRASAASMACAATLCLMAPTAWAQDSAVAVSSDMPVYDGARLIATEKRDQLSRELSDFERRTGWRVRVLTSYGADARPPEDQLWAAWRPDRNTVVVNFDSSNPSLTNFIYLGDDVLARLRRPFWYELQARYGSIFYVRDEGEQAAILNTMSALTQCLEEGCKVVPGLTSDQYGFTLALSVAGGVIAGAALRLEPTSWVTNRWLWVLLFSPLWGSLFFSFGLGPVYTRTDDVLPLLANTAAFLVAAASPHLLAALRQPSGGSGAPQ